MNVEERPLSEISQQATRILAREMGIVNTLRFLGQFSGGTGNYTKERHQWLDQLSMGEITREIKAGRNLSD